MAILTTNLRLHCHGQAKTFAISDLLPLIGNLLGYPNQSTVVFADDILHASNSSGRFSIGELFSLYVSKNSSVVSPADRLRVQGQSLADTISVQDLIDTMGATYGNPPIFVNSGDPLVPPLVINGVDYGSTPYQLFATRASNGGTKLNWTFPQKWVDGVTLVPGGAPNGGTTHWPFITLTIQRSATSINTPPQFPFHLITGTSPTPPPTTPDWVNIQQYSSSSMDVLLAALRDPANPTQATFTDNTVPAPTFNYRIIMNLGPFGIGPGGTAELDWNIVTATVSVPSGNLVWEQAAVTSGGIMLVTNSAKKSNGNIVTCGTIQGSFNLGNGISLTSSGGDSFIAEYNDAGTIIAARLFGGPCAVKGLAIDSSDNIIASGVFGNPVNFGNGVTISPVATSSNGDIFVVKFNAAQIAQWAVRFGTTSPIPSVPAQQQTCTNVAVDATNNIYFAARITGTVVFGGTTLLGIIKDMALVKLAPTGSVTFAVLYTGSGIGDQQGILPIDLTIDMNGAIVLCGHVSVGANPGGGVVSNDGIFLGKYSGTNGSATWVKNFTGGQAWSVATSLTTGNIAMTGTFVSSTDFGNGAPIGPGGLFLAVYIPSGVCATSKCFNTVPGAGFSSQDVGYRVIFDTANDYIVFTGQVSTSPVSFDGIKGYYGPQGLFIASFGNDLSFRWAVRSGGTGQGAEGRGLAAYLSHVTMAGDFPGQLTITTPANTITNTTPGGTVAPVVAQFII